MVIGGQAVLLYGEPRLTRDIDIALGVEVDELSKIKVIVRVLGFKILVKNDKEFVKRNMVLPTLDGKNGRQAIERGRDIKLGRTLVRFASLEDVESILLKNPKYDLVYIEKWLEKFDRSLGEHFLKIFGKIREGL